MRLPLFSVSRSGYYQRVKKKASHTLKVEALNDQIKTVFEESRQTYGSPRIQLELKKKNIEVFKSTIARRMKALNISPERKKRFKTQRILNMD